MNPYYLKESKMEETDNGPRPFTLVDAVILAPFAISAAVLIKLGMDWAREGIRRLKTKKNIHSNH
jgi:hypothetical protein